MRLAHKDFIYPQTSERKHFVSHYTSKCKPGNNILILIVILYSISSLTKHMNSPVSFQIYYYKQQTSWAQ